MFMFYKYCFCFSSTLSEKQVKEFSKECIKNYSDDKLTRQGESDFQILFQNLREQYSTFLMLASGTLEEDLTFC